MTAYRTAEEACSYGMAGAHVRAEEAKERLEMAQDTLRRQARINFLLNQEVTA
ncbi:hypothetical protein [Pedobacter africanus]|nr:hypothetical protein [Pedobacter africanus]